MRILIPLDGSPLAERALAPAALLARNAVSPTTITLLWVDTHDATQAMLAEEFSAELAVDLPDHAPQQLRYLTTMRTHPDLDGIDVAIEIIVGEPAPAITKVAQEQNMQLIVMASHVMTAFDAAMWGSVTEVVARTSSVPTLIIRPEGPLFSDEAQARPFIILVPLDETLFAESALPSAVLFAQACHGEVLLYHVVLTDDPRYYREEASYAYLDRVASRLAESGVKVEKLLGRGNTAASIAEVMRDVRVDVVAIATHGHQGLSVAEQVLHQITTPMLVIHPQFAS